MKVEYDFRASVRRSPSKFRCLHQFDVMPMPNPSDSLPTYERPPVVETVLGVQFDPIANFGNASSARFGKLLIQPNG